MMTKNDLYQALFKESKDSIYIADQEGCIIDCNQAALDLFGCTKRSLSKQNIADFLVDPGQLQKLMKKVQKESCIKDFPIKIKHADGRELEALLTTTVQQDKQRKSTTYLSIIRDVTERQQLENRLRTLEQKQALLIQQTPMAIIGWNSDFKVSDWNSTAEKMFGHSLKKARGKHVRYLFPKTMHRTITAAWKKLAQQSESNETVYDNITANGSTITCHWYNTPLFDADGNFLGITSMVQDMTSLALREREVAVSAQIAQEIAASANLDELYRRVVIQIQEQFHYYHTQLLGYDPALDTIGLIVGYGDVGEQMLAMNYSVPMDVGLVGKAAATGESLLQPDISTDTNWQPNPFLPDTKSELTVPIKLGRKILGVLDVQSDKVNGINEDDQMVLEGLCGQIAVAIESMTLREDMESRLRELNSLQRQTSREGWHLYHRTKAQSLGFEFNHAGVKPILELKEDANNKGKKKGKRKENGQVMNKSTPLQVRGEVIGTLGIQDDPERPLTEEDLEFISAVSEELSEPLEAARLFEQTQDALAEQERLASELETVAQVSTAASTILETDALLQSVVDLSKSSFNLYHSHIYLMNESGNKLILKAGAGNIGRLMSLEGLEISIDAESLVAHAARTRQGVVSDNVRKSVDFLPHPLLPNTMSEMAVPMIVGDKLIGVLDLQSDKENFFSEEDLEIQKVLTAQVAVAVENSQQYSEQVQTASKLRELDQLKSEFLASMSHELRTPLNSIIGFADVLLEGLDGELNERMEEDVRLIRESGRHLRELIGEILDMSKIESGKMELRYETIDIPQMSQDIMATANPLAQEKGLELILDMDKNVNTIEADRTRLRQIMWNIMGNAIKFTEKGSVTLSVQAKSDHLLFSIRDTGIGIKEENKSVVFEQFRQIDGGLNRAAGGTGLGMPITKKLVELHGGEIWVDSVYGQGSTFLFTIPIEAQAVDPMVVATISE